MRKVQVDNAMGTGQGRQGACARPQDKHAQRLGDGHAWPRKTGSGVEAPDIGKGHENQGG